MLPFTVVIQETPKKRRYTFWKFIGDSIMTVLTGGLWLIWCFFRWAGNR